MAGPFAASKPKFKATEHFSVKEVRKLHVQFNRMAKNGTVDAQQFRQCLGILGLVKDSLLCQRLFAVFNKRKNGSMNFDEYVAGLGVLLKGSVDEKLTFAFQMADIDDNGLVSFGELVLTIQSIMRIYNGIMGEGYGQSYMDIDLERVQRMFSRLDKNKDGKINLQEYVQGMKKHPEFIASIRGADMFNATRSRQIAEAQVQMLMYKTCLSAIQREIQQAHISTQSRKQPLLETIHDGEARLNTESPKLDHHKPQIAAVDAAASVGGVQRDEASVLVHQNDPKAVAGSGASFPDNTNAPGNSESNSGDISESNSGDISESSQEQESSQDQASVSPQDQVSVSPQDQAPQDQTSGSTSTSPQAPINKTKHDYTPPESNNTHDGQPPSFFNEAANNATTRDSPSFDESIDESHEHILENNSVARVKPANTALGDERPDVVSDDKTGVSDGAAQVEVSLSPVSDNMEEPSTPTTPRNDDTQHGASEKDGLQPSATGTCDATTDTSDAPRVACSPDRSSNDDPAARSNGDASSDTATDTEEFDEDPEPVVSSHTRLQNELLRQQLRRTLERVQEHIDNLLTQERMAHRTNSRRAELLSSQSMTASVFQARVETEAQLIDGDSSKDTNEFEFNPADYANYTSERTYSDLSRVLKPTAKGVTVFFGHKNWDLAINVMKGIQIATGRSVVETSREVTAFDFTVKEKYTLVTGSPFQHKPNTAFHVGGSKGESHCRFVDYAPFVFNKLRHHFGISNQAYVHSIGPGNMLSNLMLGTLTCLSELGSEGKSGSFFYFTSDNKYMIKTLHKEEHKLLRRILPSYFEHMVSSSTSDQVPESLLCRIVGCHVLRLTKRNHFGAKKIYLIVMTNMLQTDLEISKRYDLKGSWVGRRVSAAARKEHKGTMKDLDFLELGERLSVGEERKKELMSSLRYDVQFLTEHRLIDYSLLVGIHESQEMKSMIKSSVTYLSTESDFAVDDESVEDRTPFHRRDNGGMKSVDGNQTYVLGVIDFLTPYSNRKRAERVGKACFCQDPRGISVIPPASYGKRFLKFMDKVME